MANAAPDRPAADSEPWVEVLSSRGFGDWMAGQQVSLAFSTYQTGKPGAFCLGRKSGRPASHFSSRTFDRCMGLWADGA